MNSDELLAWTKSSFSGTANCVEVAVAGDSVLLRDTKDRAGAVLAFTTAEWQAFLLGVNAGEFSAGTRPGQ